MAATGQEGAETPTPLPRAEEDWSHPTPRSVPRLRKEGSAARGCVVTSFAEIQFT